MSIRFWPESNGSLGRMASRLSAMLPSEQLSHLRRRLGRARRWEAGFDLTAPPPPPGEVIGPPDIVGVGVPDGGTRWWSALIDDHPGVSEHDRLATDRHYLSHFACRSFGADEVKGYHGWFPRRPGTITGEWTPTYIGDPWVLPLLHKAAPDARILVMVREPIVRLRLDLDRSIDRRRANAGSHMAESIDRSFYARSMKQLLRYFPADRVLVLQYERCVADPLTELAATYRFLGLDDEHRPSTAARPRPSDELPPLDTGTEERLIELYASDVADLQALVPTLDLSLWPRFDQAIRRRDGR